MMSAEQVYVPISNSDVICSLMNEMTALLRWSGTRGGAMWSSKSGAASNTHKHNHDDGTHDAPVSALPTTHANGNCMLRTHVCQMQAITCTILRTYVINGHRLHGFASQRVK